jgi:hypothetical protein
MDAVSLAPGHRRADDRLRVQGRAGWWLAEDRRPLGLDHYGGELHRRHPLVFPLEPPSPLAEGCVQITETLPFDSDLFLKTLDRVVAGGQVSVNQGHDQAAVLPTTVGTQVVESPPAASLAVIGHDHKGVDVSFDFAHGVLSYSAMAGDRAGAATSTRSSRQAAIRSGRNVFRRLITSRWTIRRATSRLPTSKQAVLAREIAVRNHSREVTIRAP